MNPLDENIAEAFRALKQIEDHLTLAEDHQWNRPPNYSDSGEKRRQEGVHSDPTGETASDPVRLRLREAVLATERDSFALRQALYRIEARLRRALEPYRT